MTCLKYKKTIFGIIIFLTLLFLSFMYPLFGPNDFNKVFFLYDKNGKLIGVPPIKPSTYYPLGSDRNGQDILYMLIYGAKFTLLTAFGVTILRVLIGGILGIVLSLWLKKLLPLVKDFLLVFNLVPPIIITLALMTPVAFVYIKDAIYSILIYQIIILVIMGVPAVLQTTTEIIEEIKGKSFVQCSYLMGGSHLHVLKTQLVPFLKGYGVLVCIQQLLNTFILMMYLGTFQVFIGGVSQEEIRGVELLNSNSKEWAGLIGQNRYEFFRSPHLVIVPLLAYCFVIMIVNMMKKELETSMDINSLDISFKKRKQKKERFASDQQLKPVTKADLIFKRDIS